MLGGRHDVLDGRQHRSEPHESERGGHQEQCEGDRQRLRHDGPGEEWNRREERDRRDDRVGTLAGGAESIRQRATHPQARDAADQQDRAVIQRRREQR